MSPTIEQQHLSLVRETLDALRKFIDESDFYPTQLFPLLTGSLTRPCRGFNYLDAQSAAGYDRPCCDRAVTGNCFRLFGV